MGIVFGKVAVAARADSSNGVGGTTSVNNSAVEWSVPVEIVNAKRADGADDGRWVLKNGGKTGNASFGDGFKDNFGRV